ncbi:hypothetical protein [Micromonospora sp. NPDC005173]|uniref:hypothetical protein n=1 Tax=Micromonospora sp. NPDC005173 TaxID=3157165 RepID=UPI00339DEF57
MTRRGRRVNRKRVKRIMRQRGIVGITRRRRRSLTRQDARHQTEAGSRPSCSGVPAGRPGSQRTTRRRRHPKTRQVQVATTRVQNGRPPPGAYDDRAARRGLGAAPRPTSRGGGAAPLIRPRSRVHRGVGARCTVAA